jgi:S1-C subfamily serine protease
MAIALSCPGCESTLNVSETLIGKSIKCKSCGEIIAVTAPGKASKAAVKKAAMAVSDDEDDHPRSKSPRRRDDDEDRPKKSDTKSSKTPAILGLAAAGLILLGSGAGGAYWLFGPKKQDDVAKVTTPAPATSPTPTEEGKPAEEKKEQAKAQEAKNPENENRTPKADEKSESKSIDKSNEKSDTPTETNPKPPEAVKPVGKNEDQNPGDNRAGLNSSDKRRLYLSGEMDDLTMMRSKKGTVFIKCETPFSASTGSGWFGLEENIIITNAHVIEMKAPNSVPPTKLTIWVNSGEYGQNPGIKEREIPHQRIKILAVDRHNDIAILQIIGEKDLPSPFKVKMSAELRENQGVTIGGFPLGFSTSANTGSRKNPSVSMRKSSVAALRYDDTGTLRNIQCQGGMSPGNSGGPQFDADGNVIGMNVSGFTSDTGINFAVPTEHIVGLMAGRIDDVEVETAYLKDGMVNIPIRVTIQDPMKRLKSIGVATWIGDSNGQIRPPGETRKGQINSDKDYKEIDLKYETSTKEAKGILQLPPLTTGLAYWIQPFYANAITPKYFLPGTKIDLKGPPVELKPANLVANIKPGPIRPFTLVRKSAENDYAEGEGQSKDERVKLIVTMKGTEQVIAKAANDTQSAARLRLKYNDCDLKADGNNRESLVIPPRFMKQMKDGIGQLEAFAFVNSSGEIYKTQTNALGVTDPIVRQLGPFLSEETLESLKVCSIPMPGGEKQPNENWKISRQIKYFLSFVEPSRNRSGGSPQRPGEGDEPRPGAGNAQGNVVARREYVYQSEVKFTYQGIRSRGGRSEAVIKIEGKVTPAAGKPKDSANGFTKGYAFVDIATGVVIDADIDNEFELDTSIQGLKKRLYSMNNFKLTRDGSVK